MKKTKITVAIALSILLAFPPNALAEVIGKITYAEGRVDRRPPGSGDYLPFS